MSEKDNSATGTRSAETRQQEEALRQKETELQRLAGEKNKEEFFKQIVPLLRPLKSYIKRRLRIAYLTLEVRTPIVTSGDILDKVIFDVFQNYDRKPADLSLEQWLYQIANRKIVNFISRQRSKEKRRESLETLTQAELRTLEEMPITADAEGEPWLPEDLDDSEIPPREFKAPAHRSNPEEELEREEELEQVLQALWRLPEQGRIVFDLFVIEGFSKESVGKILGLPPEDVPKIAERAKKLVREQIEEQFRKSAETQKKAS